MKGERTEIMQENLTITTGMMAAKVKKIPNWRAPGPDGVQGFWLRILARDAADIAA